MEGRNFRKIRFWLILLLVLHGLSYGWYRFAMHLTFQQQMARNGSWGRDCLFWIVGDSHPFYDIDPMYLKSSENLAATSENYVLNYFKIKNYLKSGKKPVYIILPAEYHSFSKQGLSLLFHHELDDLYWADLIDAEALARDCQSSEPKRWKWVARYFPYAGQYYRGLTTPFKAPVYIEKAGFFASNDIFDQQPNPDQLARDRVHSHTANHGLMDPVQILYLQKILDLCQREDILAIGIRFPIHPTYNQKMVRLPEVQQVDSLIQARFSQSILWDYRHFFDQETGNFCDPDHLNAAGAKKLTLDIRRRVFGEENNP